ncbi:MAG: AraC family transcriptional regulator [Pseudooceanicola sp.]|jgi:AraC-like DNA-binding protein|nr:AraC family transcriptional regulator [Pseudooceanicola sp.]
MLTYEAKHWEERASRRGDYRSTLFSAPDAFNMSRGPDRHLRVNSATFPLIGTSLLSVSSSGHEIDLADESFLTIMLPTRGVTRVRMDRTERVIGEGGALALGPSERWTQVDPRGHRDFRANVAKIDLKQIGRGKIFPEADTDPVVPVSTPALEGFRGLMRYLFADLASPVPTLVHQPASDLFAALVLEHLRHLLASSNADPALDGSQANLVRRATDYMVACSGDPLTVPAIAEMVGVSTRRLQDAFRLTTGRTPWEHLTEIRLANARTRLLAAAGPSVTAIAFDCGFSHLGRFSQTYRDTYGEAPSVTLTRARDSAHAAHPAIRIGPAQIG